MGGRKKRWKFCIFPIPARDMEVYMGRKYRYIALPVTFLFVMVIFSLYYIENSRPKKETADNPMSTPNSTSNYYTENFRPQYHLSPESGNMSDPNGMVYFEGEYHQFYQNKGQWGHAVSKDLIHWEHLPLALVRDELGDIWSGSAVVDWHNTSGFFNDKPGLVAIFTHFKQGVQSQSIAYSTDRGRTWTKYSGNPVIPNPGLKDFRDPKVFWYEPAREWVMVVSAGNKVLFYRSPNLKEWRKTGEFGIGHGSHAAVWECPDLFELPVEGSDQKKWVLTVSIGNNTWTKGSAAQYFIGTFDGETFVNENAPEEVLWTDWGKDFYAAVSYSDIPSSDGRRIWLGWMSNWRYPFSMPTGAWKGNMSIPRELRLRHIPGEGLRLVQLPVKELEQLRGKPAHFSSLELDSGNNPLKGIKGTSFELELEFSLLSKATFGVKLRKGETEETVVSYDAKNERLIVDRTKSGVSSFEPGFAEDFSAPLKPKQGKIKLRIFVDEMTLEVFANDGEAVLSAIMFPEPTSNGMELFVSGGKVLLENLNYYPMRTIWRDENPDGKVPLRIVTSKSVLFLKRGESETVRASVIPLSAPQEVKWVSGDSEIASVKVKDRDAITINGVKPGKTSVQVTTPDGNLLTIVNVFVDD
jgi:fructan beta-fructosidase